VASRLTPEVKGRRSLQSVHSVSLACTPVPEDETTSCPLLRALRSLRDFHEERGDPGAFDAEMRRELARLEALDAVGALSA
jgi:hypothetical protein